MRIVSLLPSATEMICQLGLREQLVGVTHECDYPPFVVDLPKVTRTLIPENSTSSEIDALVREQLKTQKALYSLDVSTLERLRPDLIVSQTLCEVCAVGESEVAAAVGALSTKPRILNLTPTRLSDVFDSIRLIGEATGRTDVAADVVESLESRVARVMQRTEGILQRKRVVLLEWIDPPFSSGHWTPELIRMAGGIEGVGREGHPSRTMNWEEVTKCDPDVIVVACCGFTVERTLIEVPLLRKISAFRELRCVRDENVFVIDGHAYFNRPGPRLVESLELLAHLLHPETHPLPADVIPAQRLTRRWLLD